MVPCEFLSSLILLNDLPLTWLITIKILKTIFQLSALQMVAKSTLVELYSTKEKCSTSFKELREEFNNMKIEREPKAKKIFAYFDKAAQNGEDEVDCDKEYPKCTESLDGIKRETQATQSSY
ncbi:hypothetical protein TNCV_1912531 [Trichonephila clavipes]|nr:hypothetical protein TNCV_1912531 [Trichonephila clavipes]